MIPSGGDARFTLIGLPVERRHARFAREVAEGLTAVPKHLPCCYFYDRLGSQLFEAICELPEYYLTRAETAILRTQVEEIAALFDSPTDLIELGSGNATKTRLLIDVFARRHARQRYVPIDICRTMLEESSRDLLRTFPSLEVLAIAAEYHEALEHLRTSETRRKLVLWLGSNVGNLERAAAADFLSRVCDTLKPGDGILVGFDLRKDRRRLEEAYDDACGVTAAFNRNLLCRINRELDGSFEPRAFKHRAIYNEGIGRIEMHLESEVAQVAVIKQLGLSVSFAAGEMVHTENSYKYSPDEIEALATAAGLIRERAWLDPEGLFTLVLLGKR